MRRNWSQKNQNVPLFFRLCLPLCRLRSAYDLVKTRLSESGAEAKELNQSQSVGACTMISLSFRFCFRLRQSGFRKRSRKKWKRSDSSDYDSVALMIPPTTPIFDFH